jgi:predicted transcriptional regulator
MAETTTITIRIPAELRDKLDRLADATKRSRSYVAADALAEYAENELKIVEGIMRGLDDAKAGRVTPHDEAMTQLRQRVTKAAAKSKKRTA